LSVCVVQPVNFEALLGPEPNVNEERKDVQQVDQVPELQVGP